MIMSRERIDAVKGDFALLGKNKYRDMPNREMLQALTELLGTYIDVTACDRAEAKSHGG
jgi:hypothetical protein